MKTCCNLANRSIPVLMLTLVMGCSQPPASDARLEPPLVVVSKATWSGGEDTVYTGVVKARVESNIGFRVAGKVIERKVDVGQAVRKGQVLMRLDRNDLLLNYSAQAAAVATAKAKYTQAVADEARLNGLSEQGAISAQAYDAVKAGLDAAAASLEAAKAQANIAKNADSYAELVADADGIVVGVFVEPGQVVASGQAVVRVAKNGPREAEVYLPESVRPAIGSEATAQIYSEQSKKYRVHLRELSKAADPASRTFTARYVIPDSPAIPLGSTVSVELNSVGEPLLQIPLSAIYDDGQTVGIWIVNPDNFAVSLRKVSVKQVSAEFVFVTGEVSQAEQIVALGAHLLHEGQRVRVADSSKVVLK
ncbi:efflux RND transporter periplasmic adaptor subunit [Methylomonas paludis]|uniref:Efflux RND transporter periplasmic adaptor subunit n=1 Tax=Methylomonas paludis TaxID=1173101 RepID=A0A975R8T9_9GAMM|nr:efflux RND transporter periplasmic adaptor subunit [Methylomonas paludis]QWF69529.1 efflux RND transporter periplasmic adaptor subunit [Methylomonas paludis]